MASLWHWFGSSQFPPGKKRPRQRAGPGCFRPRIEDLEGRLLLSIFRVLNTNDSGFGSLRQAIRDANAEPAVPHTIVFRIGTGLQSIRPSSPLPTITRPMSIDGTTQPGFAGSPVIELNGSSLGEFVPGLTISAGNSTVRALVINGWRGSGIVVQTNGGNLIAGNYIGTDVTGTIARGNQGGIWIDNTPNNTIGETTPGAGNVIVSSSMGAGGADIFMDGNGATDNLVQGNYIGTDVTGTVVLSEPSFTGVHIGQLASRNTIGGTADGARNVISGHSDAFGIGLHEAPGNLVQGNYIGTDVTGTAALGNGFGVYIEGGENTTVGGTTAAAGNLISGNPIAGILLSGKGSLVQGNFIGTDVTGTTALGNGVGIEGGDNTTVGGTTTGAGNLISGNREVGIVLGDALVQGNFIGTDVTGTVALGNLDGVVVGFSRVTIGGTMAGAGNLISGNRGNGISLIGRSLVQGNYIGMDVTGTTALGNGANGVLIRGNSSTIGGTAAGAANRIAFNGNDGVVVDRGTENSIRRNVIFAHEAGLGIRLLNGGNHRQESPVLTSVTSGGGIITIEGTLLSTSNTTFTAEFFANTVCNPSGFGEGERFLGSTTLTSDADGSASFTVAFAIEVPVGQFIATTATDPEGNTSQFSECVQVTEPSAPTWAGPGGNDGHCIRDRAFAFLDRYAGSAYLAPPSAPATTDPLLTDLQAGQYQLALPGFSLRAHLLRNIPTDGFVVLARREFSGGNLQRDSYAVDAPANRVIFDE